FWYGTAFLIILELFQNQEHSLMCMSFIFITIPVLKKYIFTYKDDDDKYDGHGNNQPVIHQFDPYKGRQYDAVQYECSHNDGWICFHLTSQTFEYTPMHNHIHHKI